MNSSFHFIAGMLWLMLAAFNFSVQILYFFNDRKIGLYRIKKATTPALLFSGLLIVVLQTGGFPLVPCAVLAAMGLGELGIEGSSVVEKRGDGDAAETVTPPTVLLAGVLFLLVNIFIGGRLIANNPDTDKLLIAVPLSLVVIAVMLLFTILAFRPRPDTRTQMLLYSIGLVILLCGVIADLFSGISQLGRAAGVLTLSDSLVLIRMGAGFDKRTRAGFRTLLVFLIVILLLYYFYMWMLISMGRRP